jgi:hypothetical protein
MNTLTNENPFRISKATEKEIERLTSTDMVDGNINDVLNAIECIKVSESAIYIKFNKDLYLHSKNSIQVCDNLKIDIAKQIHLNPEVKLYHKIQGTQNEITTDSN